MQPLIIRSFAKLNLTFEILGTLPGGYHEVRTIFHSIDLSDKLIFELSAGSSGDFEVELQQVQPVSVGSPVVESGTPALSPPTLDASFPLDDSNLIVKAAKKFEALTGCGAGQLLKVRIEKNTPIAAGLAGGSSNAAATLKAMQLMFRNHCQSTQADEIAAQLGSDINFCLSGGTQIGTNRGEILAPVKANKAFSFVLLKPREIAISTPWIYGEYDASLSELADEERPVLGNNHSSRCQQAIASDDIDNLAKTFFNAFEPVCFAHYPAVRELRDFMLKAGSLSAHITGSGPTLFGLARTREHALEIQQKLLKDAGSASQVQFDCWVAESSGCGVRIESEAR